MKLVGTFLLASMLFGLCSTTAEAYYYRRPVYLYNAEEAAKQQRANMAEQTHQMKELMESQRLNNERQRISASSTVKEYAATKERKQMRKRSRTALVQSRLNRNPKFQNLQ